MEGLNISLSSAVQRRVSKARNAMSKETYKLQRSFTAFLVVQVCCLAVSTVHSGDYPLHLHYHPLYDLCDCLLRRLERYLPIHSD